MGRPATIRKERQLRLVGHVLGRDQRADQLDVEVLQLVDEHGQGRALPLQNGAHVLNQFGQVDLEGAGVPVAPRSSRPSSA